ncbi:transposable element Tcb1 transposase [Trichonephila clavipes]|nr:transposable element Tcb1 transposase [Trichonephila clavipes]
MNSEHGLWNERVLCYLTNAASACNITVVVFEFGDTGERFLNCYFIHCHTNRAPGIMVCGGIEFHCRTPLVCIAGTLNSQCYNSEVLDPVVLPYIQRLPSAIFHLDNARPHVACNVQKLSFSHQIELFLWPACSPDLSRMCGSCLHNDWSGIQHPLLDRMNFDSMSKPHGLL